MAASSGWQADQGEREMTKREARRLRRRVEQQRQREFDHLLLRLAKRPHVPAHPSDDYVPSRSSML
jgi:hypothetical protein